MALGLWAFSLLFAPAFMGRGVLAQPRRFLVINACEQPLWIAHEAAASVGPDPQNVRIAARESHAFLTPSGLSATRYWPKVACDEQGDHCVLGGSGGPKESCVKKMASGTYNYSACAPPIDTKFEASFGQMGEPCNPSAPGGTQMKGCDYVDMSLVDGWTLAFKLEIQGQCTASAKGVESKVQAIDCSSLSFDDCPAEEDLGTGHTVDLRAMNPNTGAITGCYAPCQKLTDSKWNNSGDGHHALNEHVAAPYCCPTPPISPEACRQGPVASTRFVRTLHQKCLGVYAYSYDDGHGLMRCSADSIYKLTLYCPFEAAGLKLYKTTTTTSTTTTTRTTSTTSTTSSTIGSPYIFRYDVTGMLCGRAGFGTLFLLPLALVLGCGSRWKRKDVGRRVLAGLAVNDQDDHGLHDISAEHSAIIDSERPAIQSGASKIELDGGFTALLEERLRRGISAERPAIVERGASKIDLDGGFAALLARESSEEDCPGGGGTFQAGGLDDDGFETFPAVEVFAQNDRAVQEEADQIGDTETQSLADLRKEERIISVSADQEQPGNAGRRSRGDCSYRDVKLSMHSVAGTRSLSTVDRASRWLAKARGKVPEMLV